MAAMRIGQFDSIAEPTSSSFLLMKRYDIRSEHNSQANSGGLIMDEFGQEQHSHREKDGAFFNQEQQQQ
jgi:hypothetical protein